MRILIYLFVYLFVSQCIAQNKETVYLFFEANSNEICNIPESQQGKYHGDTKAKKYQKILQNDKSVDFYICNELFLFSRRSTMDTCSIDYLKMIKLSKIEALIERVNKVNPLYPDQVFEKVYLLEKINDSTIVKYDVKWQYYIE